MRQEQKESYWCNGFMHFTKILGLFFSTLVRKVKSVWLNSAVNFFALVAQRIWIAILVHIPPSLAAAKRVLYAFLKCILADLFCVCFWSLIGQISYWFMIVENFKGISISFVRKIYLLRLPSWILSQKVSIKEYHS